MSASKNIYIKTILAIVLCFTSFVFIAQTKSSTIKTINGKKFYIHKVEKGQSLYAIAKTYEIDVNSILAENDEAIDGLRAGQELKIPFESLMPKQASAIIDTNKYVYHKITKGETIYSITRKHNIDEKKLFSYNPGLTPNVKEGDYIIVGEKKKTTTIINNNQTNSTYIAQQGETVYGISKKLNVSQDDLFNWNPELKDGLKQGQIIKYASSSTRTTQITSPPTNTFIQPDTKEVIEVKDDIPQKPKKNNYTIGLFLPFKLSESETLNIDELAKANAKFPFAQDLSIDFYSGFKKAVDSLITDNFDLSIRLYDTDDRDSSTVESICKSSEFKSLDVIFGPLYAGVFKIVTRYAKANNIPIISPVIQQNKILFESPNASKTTPSVYTLIESLADFTLDSLSNSRVIVVNPTTKDIRYIRTFKAEYNDGLLKRNHSLRDSAIEVKGIAGVKSAYYAGKKNIIVLLTNNQVYLQDFITQLNMFADKKDIVLMGFQSVSSIDNLDQEYLNNLQFHFASANHLDYQDSLTKNLIKQYQNVYNSDPSDYYFLGFDLANYYLKNLQTNGPDFFKHLDAYSNNGIFTGFNFFRPDNETGFENTVSFIYRYSNYKLHRIPWKY